MKRSIILIVIGLILMACSLGRALPPTSTPAQTMTIEPTSTPGPAVAELLVAKANPGSLIVDKQALYWSSCDAWESKDGKVNTYDMSQRTTKTLAEGVACPFTVKADDQSLYWIDHEGIEGGAHSILRLAKSGGQPEVVFSDASVFQNLLIADGELYWWSKDWAGMRLPNSGGKPEALPFAAKYILAFNGGEVYWQNAQQDLIRSQKDGSQAETLIAGSEFAPAEMGGHHISRGISAVYPRPDGVYLKTFTDGNPGMVSCTDQHTAIMRVDKNGGKPAALVEAAGFADDLLIDKFVYFAGNCVEGISKASLEDGSSQPFIKDTNPESFLTGDGEYIYWVTSNDWSIYRARR